MMPEFIHILRSDMRNRDAAPSLAADDMGAVSSPVQVPMSLPHYQQIADLMAEPRHMPSKEVRRQASTSVAIGPMLACALALSLCGAVGAVVLGKGIANLAHFNVNFQTQN